VRYTSSISGSSWLNAPFTFLDEERFSMTDFLGPVPSSHDDLKSLTLESLRRVPKGSFVKACADASVTFNEGGCGPFWGDCLQDDCCRSPELGAWSQATMEAYLRPFDLLDEGSVMAPPSGTNAFERASRAVQGTKGVKVLPMRRGAPYPIIVANCQVGSGLSAELLPVEFTPLYSGVPTVVNVNAHTAGGGVIESFGIGSPAPESLPCGGKVAKNGEEVTVTPGKFVSLSFAAGASGGFLTRVLEFAKMPAAIDDFVGGSRLQLWSPLDIKSEANGNRVVGDGGGGGDIALLALLRRGVKRVIVQLTTTHAIKRLAQEEMDDPSKVAAVKKAFLQGESYLPLLFGSDASGRDVDDPRKKVFEPSVLDDLFRGALEKVKDGKSVMVVTKGLRVLENGFYNVPGKIDGKNYEVDILWCFPDPSAKFIAGLPSDTQNQLRAAESAIPQVSGSVINEGFPYVATIAGNFDAALVRLLAENTAYNLLHGVDENFLADFVGAA